MGTKMALIRTTKNIQIDVPDVQEVSGVTGSLLSTEPQEKPSY